MNVLMLSSSRAHGSDYLAYNQDLLQAQLHAAHQIVFIPYAGISLSYAEYTQKVQAALPDKHIIDLSACADKMQALAEADAVLVGGGNTFHLLHQLYAEKLLAPLRELVFQGLTYVGWSAGSNICGLSIRTTNDMPIVQPAKFTALGLVPYQLNPHYLDERKANFHGETRDERLQEFCLLNPKIPVIALPEGTALLRQGDSIKYLGNEPGVVFSGQARFELPVNTDLRQFLPQ